MMEIFYDVLLNAGPLGILAIYAIWTQREGQKRLDTLQGEFMARVEQLNEKGQIEREALTDKMEQREKEIIDRWRSVVEKVESERDEAQKDTLRQIEKILNKLDRLIHRGSDAG
mgnify:CR=1 FL=1